MHVTLQGITSLGKNGGSDSEVSCRWEGARWVIQDFSKSRSSERKMAQIVVEQAKPI